MRTPTWYKVFTHDLSCGIADNHGLCVTNFNKILSCLFDVSNKGKYALIYILHNIKPFYGALWY
jgi:hypothetical protein